MYRKRIFSIIGFLLCLVIFSGMISLKAKASSEDTQNVFDDKTSEIRTEPGDILLIYNDNPGESEISQIQSIVEISSELRKVIDFGSWNEVKGVAAEYKYIIFYNITDYNEELLELCNNPRINRLLIGSSTMKNFLEYRGHSDFIEGEIEASKSVLNYTLPSGTNFSKQILDTDLLSIPKAEETGDGQIKADGKTFSFSSKLLGLRYIPLTDFSSQEAKLALANEITFWMWPYKDKPTEYAEYIVLDEVYPFMKTAELLEKVQIFVDEKVPFIISVMPITENTDYPAMKEFCQILSYAQANGGMIVLHAPIIHKEVEDIDELYKQLTDMTFSYIDNGVYPMGIQVPRSWLYDSLFLKVLERYSSVFVYEDNAGNFSLDEHTSLFTRHGHQSIYELHAIDETGLSYLPYYSSSVYLKPDTKSEDIRELIKRMKGSDQSFKDLLSLDHFVWLNDNKLSYESGTVYLNGESKELTFTPYEFEDDFNYNKSVIEKITISLESQNKYLIAAAIGIILLFTYFIVLTRVQNHRSFFHDYDVKKEKSGYEIKKTKKIKKKKKRKR